MKTEWTNAPSEVKEFLKNNSIFDITTIYNKETNTKYWEIRTTDKKITKFEQYFNMNFFNK